MQSGKRTQMQHTFGELLLAFRSSAGLTQEELAERAGLSAQEVSDLERGTRTRPYPATIQRLAQALGLSELESQTLRAAARQTTPSAESEQLPSHRLAPAPASLTSFVGREQEIADLQALLDSSRLVTLTGSGGVGKTRLAMQTIAGLAPIHDGRALLIELAPLSDTGLLEQTVLAAVGGPDIPGQSTFDTLAARLGSHEYLLVLDNCEHLVDACAGLVEGLLRHCPGLRVLVTIREILKVPGESLVRVPSLGVPPSDSSPVSEAAQHSAVQLFVERVRLVRPDFQLTEDNVVPIVQICRRLDGDSASHRACGSPHAIPLSQ
jgi:transcriptional regulator with XRE-family HTH domain